MGFFAADDAQVAARRLFASCALHAAPIRMMLVFERNKSKKR